MSDEHGSFIRKKAAAAGTSETMEEAHHADGV